MTKKLTTYIILIFVCCQTGRADGQDASLDAMRARIDHLNADIAAMTVREDSLRMADALLSDSLQVYADSVARVEESFKARKTAAKQNASHLLSERDNLQQTVRDNSARIQAEVDEMRAKEGSTDRQSVELQAYLPAYIPVMARKYREYTDGLYSAMDIHVLRAYLEDANKYKTSAEMATVITALEKAINQKQMLLDAQQLLSQPYTAAVDEALATLNATEKQYSKAQWQEIYDNLHADLSGYKYDGLPAMDKLMGKIDKVCATPTLTAAQKKENINQIFLSGEEQDNNRYFYSYIPYLGKRFQDLQKLFSNMDPDQAWASAKYKIIKNEITTSLSNANDKHK